MLFLLLFFSTMCGRTEADVRTSLVQWLRLRTPNAGGPGSVPGQGTRSHMPQLKISCATTKTWCILIKKKRYIYIYIIK